MTQITGGKPETCAQGYEGSVCGRCTPGYYRQGKTCNQCSNDAWVRAIIFGAIVLVVIVLVLTFVNMDYVSSINIVMSLFQIASLINRIPNVKWPSFASTSMEVASVSTLNTDFLSMECLVPFLRYEIKWAFTMGLPLYLLIAFVILYIVGVIRSRLAGRFGKCFKCIYASYSFHLKYQKANERLPVYFVRTKLSGLLHYIRNQLLFARNMLLWLLKEGCTSEQMEVFKNRIINAYCSFIAAFFGSIVLTGSRLFRCEAQPDNTRTMEDSPDILCYTDVRWLAMMPLAAVIVGIMILCTLLLFAYMFLNLKQIQVRKSIFRQRFSFFLVRFKDRFYFWEAVMIARQSIISILPIFFKPQLTLVLVFLVMFAVLLLQTHNAPFKQKMHNLMEYVVDISILVIMFCGILNSYQFYPSPVYPFMIQIITLITLIVSVTLVLLLFVFDVYIRRKKTMRKAKKKRTELEEQIKLRKLKGMPYMHLQQEMKTLYDDHGNIKFVPPLFVDNNDIESEEDKCQNMNQIISNLFSLKRIKKKLVLLRKKHLRIRKRVQNAADTVKKQTQFNSGAEDVQEYYLPHRKVLQVANGEELQAEENANQVV